MDLYVVSWILTLGISIIIPWAANALGILVGFPLTGVTRRLPGVPKSIDMDIQLITLIAYILDGFLCVCAGWAFFRMFSALPYFKPEVIFALAGLRIIITLRRSGLGVGGHVRSSNKNLAFEEALNYIMFIVGLIIGSAVWGLLKLQV